MNDLKDIIVDVRGNLCPKPVIETKKAIDANPHQRIVTIVDNEVSRNNVEKLGLSRGYSVTITEQGTDFYLTMVPAAMSSTEMAPLLVEPALPSVTGKVLLMTKDYLGEGNEELGRNLMKTFWTCVLESDYKPVTIFFINSAVKMVTNDSVHLDNLKAIANNGVEIAACGICLDFYNLKDQVAVGSITNMYAITDSILSENLVKL